MARESSGFSMDLCCFRTPLTQRNLFLASAAILSASWGVTVDGPV